MEDTTKSPRSLFADGVGRRKALSMLGLSGATLISFMNSRSVFAGANEIRYNSFGGTSAEAEDKYGLGPFQKETGIKIIHGTFGDLTDVLTELRASATGDINIVHMSGLDWYKRFVDLGFAAEINEEKIPNLKWVMSHLVDAFRKITPNALSAVPFAYGCNGIAYNTKYISKEEVEAAGPKILLDSKYRGKLCGAGNAQERIWYAALQTGQDPNNIQDIDAVWAKVRESRDMVKKYWGSGAEMMELFAKGEVILGDSWSGRVAALQESGFPIGYYDVPGGFSWIEGLMLFKGAPTDICEQLINYMLSPDVSGQIAVGQKYPPALDPTKVDLPEAAKKLPGFDPTGKLDHLTFPDPDYWAQNLPKWEKQWNRVSKGA